MFDWIQEHEAILWTLGVASIVVFIGSLLAMPEIIVRIPVDYFAHEQRPPSRWSKEHKAIRAAVRIGRNVMGVLFVAAGIAMLVLPGQGLLTILVGVLLIDFPHKYRFEQWLLRRRWVSRPVNWLRERRGREPLKVREPEG
jgi:hypothetical protein